MKRYILTALLLLLSGNVLAEKTATDIIPNCKPGGEMTHERAYCFGVINGIFMAAAMSEHICMPDNLRTGPALMIVFKAADNHPDKMGLPFTVFAYAALHEVYACDKPQGLST